jgi:hypothetical protein
MGEITRLLRYDLKNKIRELEDEEYMVLISDIRENIKKKKEYTIYNVDTIKYGYPDWCPFRTCYNIIQKMRLDNIEIHYRNPNILIVFHPIIKIDSKRKKNKVMNFLYKEHAASARLGNYL